MCRSPDIYQVVRGAITMDFSQISAFVTAHKDFLLVGAQSLSVLFVGGSAVGVWRQLIRTSQLNQLKATQEIIDRIVTGDFPRFRERLEEKYNCNFAYGEQTYTEATAKLSPEENAKVDAYLRKMFNLLE